jgi:hypothetical protein
MFAKAFSGIAKDKAFREAKPKSAAKIGSTSVPKSGTMAERETASDREPGLQCHTSWLYGVSDHGPAHGIWDINN